MKILLLQSYFYPENTADLHLDCDRCEAFAREGITMECYTPLPVRGVPEKVRKEYRKRRYEYMYEGSLKIHRFWMMKENHNSFLRAIRYLLSCIIHFYYGIRSKSCDIMLIVSTPPIQGAMAAIVKKIRKIPLVYNLQDVFPDSLVASGLASKGGLLWKIGRKIEDFTYKNSDIIIVVSQDIKQNILKKGVPEYKIRLIYNWVDSNRIYPIQKKNNPLFFKFNLDTNKFYVVYAGNLGLSQNINILLEAAQKLQSNNNIVFLLFGSGGIEENIKSEIHRLNISNLKLFPLQPYELVPYVYSIGDVCIVSCKKGLGGSAMPSKTWTIMSSGRPVIANFDEGELKTIIEDNKCGLFTHSEDLDELVDAVTYMYNNPKLCIEFGANARNFIVNNLSKDLCTSQYIEVLNNLTHK